MDNQPWHDSAHAVVRLWDQYTNAPSPLDAANSMVELNNAVFNLSTWLPGFNYETGRVDDDE